jgi:hypothetical protein
MAALSLLPSAARDNRRVALTLARGDDAVAELDVDAVTLTVGGSPVRHYEVECEAKGSGDATVVRAVLDDLQARYPALRAWSVSKLALGEALETLASEGRLSPLQDGERLLPEAYDAVEALAGPL